METIVGWEKYGFAGLITMAIFTLGTQFFKYLKESKKENLENTDSKKMYDQILDFTQSNIELITVLTKNLKTYEKDQKQILENMQQILNLLITISISVGKVDDRTNNCLTKK